MRRDLNALADGVFDVVVVGGGIVGVCTAWDAASRGLSVALLERGDFGCGASENCFKIVHSGIRYLQHGDLSRARRSSRERDTLLRIAPHQTAPLPLVIPTYGHGLRGGAVLLAGMRAHELVAGNRGLPAGRLLGRREVLDLFPRIDSPDLTGGGLLYEVQMHSPARLALGFLRSAAGAGARAVNYVEAVRVRTGRSPAVVEARDQIGGGTFELRARVVVNAAGGWAPRLLERSLGARADRPPTFSRDVCLVLARRPQVPYGLAVVGRTRDSDAVVSRNGRHLILAPWRDRMLLGVWHAVLESGDQGLGLTEADVRGFLDEVNTSCPGLDLAEDEVALCQSGPVLFGESSRSARHLRFGKRSVLVDHTAADGVQGLVTVIGVRYTTARWDAERVVDLVLRKLDRRAMPSATSTTPIFGGSIDDADAYRSRAVRDRPEGVRADTIESLVRAHGSEHGRVLRELRSDAGRARRLGDSAVIAAEVAYAVGEEMALTLGDVVFRRTELGGGGHPGEPALRQAAETMAELLAWDAERTEAELEAVRGRFFRGRES